MKVKSFMGVVMVSGLTACGSSDDHSHSHTSDATQVNSTSTTKDITELVFTKMAANCSEYVDEYASSVTDKKNGENYSGSLVIAHENGTCSFKTNGIPNHDFDSSSFANSVSQINQTYQMTSIPTHAANVTQLSLRLNNAVFLNGVKLDLLAAGCFGVGDGKIGCTDMSHPWRYDPMSSLNDFGTDSHNAHTQPDGSYHYHGSPMSMFYDDGSVASPVIGFAADGYPIRGSYISENGKVREVKSSYQLKSGTRTDETGYTTPSGQYNGQFRNDYQYVAGSGDLDECNGAMLDGFYSYFVTTTYPWVLGCFKGTPDTSFNK